MPRIPKQAEYWQAVAERRDALHFEGVSPAVTEAYVRYSDQVTTSEFLARVGTAKRRASMLADFGGEEINERAIEANQLWALMPNTEEVSEDTLTALAAYLEVSLGGPITVEDIELIQQLLDSEYVFQILTDKPIISQFWESKLPEHTGDTNFEISLGDNRWTDDPVHIPNGVLRDFADTVQLESIYNASIQTLDELTNYFQNIDHLLTPDNQDRATVYKKCMLAEGLLAPICEVIGHDRLSDAISDVSVKIRYALGERQDLIEKAEKQMAQLGSDKEILAATEELISATGNEMITSDKVTDHESEYKLLSREYLVMDDTGEEFRCIMRRKTIGSWVKKLHKYEKEGKQDTIQDALALSYITDQDDPDAGVLDDYNTTKSTNPVKQMMRVFGNLVQGALSPSSDIQLKPSASRQELGKYGGINIRGTQQLINAAREVLAPLFETILQQSGKKLEETVSIDKPVDHAHDFQTAKITGVFKNIPFEIQTKTALMRKQERSGRANHRRHKTGDDDHYVLPNIHKRRDKLNTVGLMPNEITAGRGKDLIRRAVEQLPMQLGRAARKFASHA